MAMTGGKYDVLLVAKHGLYPPTMEPKEGWHDCMCMVTKGTFTHPSYNTHDGDNVTWNQYGSTGVTLTTNMRPRMDPKSVDPNKLGRQTWARIDGKAGEPTSFESAHRPCKNINGM